MISTLDSMACNMECHVNLIDRLLVFRLTYPSYFTSIWGTDISWMEHLMFICVQIHSFTACNPHSVRKALMLSMVLLTYLLRSKSSIQASIHNNLPETCVPTPYIWWPLQGGGCYKLVTQGSQENHTFISKNIYMPAITCEKFLHQPSLQSCLPLLPCPSTHLLLLFPFLNGNHPWLPLDPKPFNSLHISIGLWVTGWTGNLPQANILHSLLII